MKKISPRRIIQIFLIIISLFSCYFSYGQITFQRFYNIGGGDNFGRSVAVTPDGYFIVGSTADNWSVIIRTDTLGDTLWTKRYNFAFAWSIQYTPSDGGFLIANNEHIMKGNANGSIAWTRSVNGQGGGSAVRLKSDGSYVFTGSLLSLYGNPDGLVNMGSTGAFIWKKNYNGFVYPGATQDVKETSDGGYIIVGQTHVYGAGNDDIYLVKTDILGNYVWSKTYGGTQMDRAFCVLQTTDGGYIICGFTGSFSSVDDVYLIKTDAFGNIVWSKTYGRSGCSDSGLSIIQTPDGGYVVSGDSYDYASSSGSIYVFKTDNAGNVAWSKCYGQGTSSYDNPTARQCPDGGYIITGGMSQNIYLIKTDANGNTGCGSEITVTTIVTTPATQVTSPADFSSSVTGSITTASPVLSGGGTVGTNCCMVPASITAAGPTTVCSSSSVILNANTGTGLSYQWRLNGSPIAGATLASYTASAGGSYDCIVTNSCSATSNAITVTIISGLPTPTITAGGPTSFCAPGNVVLSVTTCASCTYQWRLNGVNITGATASSRTVSAAGNYDCVVTNACGSATSNTISVVVNLPPSAMIIALGSTTICISGSVTLAASVNVGNTYQWRRNSVNISGATSDSYAATLAGSYTCQITNNGCSATSNSITVTVVNSAPFATITANGSTTVCTPGSVQLNATTGTGLSYQWLLNNAGISGATSSSYNAAVSGFYNCLVSNVCGTTISNTISVTIMQPFTSSITASGPTTFCYGNNVTLNALPTGSGYSYQWRNNGINIGGATASSYTANAQGNYDVVISNPCVATSNIIIVTIINPPTTITLQPNGAAGIDAFLSSLPSQINTNFGTHADIDAMAWTHSGIPGVNRGLVRFDLNVIPVNTVVLQATLTLFNNPTSGNNGGAHSSLSGSNASWLQKVTSPWSESTVTWNTQPTTTTANQVTLPQSTSANQDYTLDVTALVQDMVNNPANNYGFMLRLQTESYYRALIFASSDCADSTKWPKLVITLPPNPLTATITASGPTTFCAPGSVTLNANIGTGLTYQWELNSSPILGATSSSYVATAAGNYDCIVSNGCSSSTSNIITVTINITPPAVITAAGPTTFCAPGSVTLNANTGSGLSYQWRQNGTAIPGEITSPYIASAAGNYDCIVSNSCGSSTSNTITVNVDVLPIANVTAAGPTTFCSPGSVTLNVSTCNACTYQWRLNVVDIPGATSSSYSATSSGNYNCLVTNTCGTRTSNSVSVTTDVSPTATISAAGPTTVCAPNSVTLNANTGTGLSYQWRLNGGNISGETSASYNATATGNYDCVVSNTCGSVTSNVISVTINPLPTAIITAGGPTIVCSPNSVTLNANTGAGLSYQWRLDGGNISGATLSSYNTTITGNYDCIVSNSCGSIASNVISVTVNPLPIAVITAAGLTTVCSPNSVTLNANTGTGLSYQWRLNGGDISGATLSSYNATATGNYDCLVSNGCGGVASNVISVAVNPLPTAVITAGGPTSVCAPNTVMLNANTGAGLSYQWKLNGGNISGATSASYNATATGSYTCVVSNSCGNATSNAIAVTVAVLPATPGSITGQTTGVCSSTKTYTISSVSGATGYTWTVPAGASISSGQGTTSANVTFTGSFGSGNISVVATSTCGSSGSSSIAVTAVPAQPGAITGPASVCHNQNNVLYSITAVTGATSCNWTVPAGTQIKNGQGTTQIRVRFGNSAGNITVTANNACGQSPVRALAIAMPCREGDEISTEGSDIILYPNPATNQLTIYDVHSAIEKIEVFNAIGQSILIQKPTASSQQMVIDISKLTPGLYFAEIISGEQKQVIKFIKQE